MERKLTRGILYVLLANMVTLIVNLLTNFLLPKFLSVDSYASIKTFQLYINYVGAFHLGFVDGVYLKYGGEDIKNLNQESLAKNLATLRLFQLLVTIFMIVISFAVRDWIILAFSLAILPVNVVGYFRMLFQAIGEFGLYSKVMNLTTVLTFAANLFLVFALKSDHYIVYLAGYVIVDLFIWLLLEFLFAKRMRRLPQLGFSLKEFIGNIKLGFFLMCGNFASFFLTGMDRWFVKFTLDNLAFAQYSFAVSMENMLNLAITPVTLPLYNYFCKEKSKEKVKMMHKAVILVSTILISVSFLAEWAIDMLLPTYRDSVEVVFWLFAGQAFQFVVKAIYVNLYKVQKKQHIYFYKLIMIICAGFLFNYGLFQIIGSKEAYAIGTYLSAVLWLFISVIDFKNIEFDKSDIVYLVLESFIFIICGLKFEPIIGLLIYFSITLILIYALMHNTLSAVFSEVKEKGLKFWR